MKRIDAPRRMLLDPIAVRDGADPQLDPAIAALLEERITAAVQEATAPLQNTIDRLSQNRDSILREKRELERAAVKEAEDREAARPQFVPITREQARDPQTYRRVKAEAERLGVPMKSSTRRRFNLPSSRRKASSTTRPISSMAPPSVATTPPTSGTRPRLSGAG